MNLAQFYSWYLSNYYSSRTKRYLVRAYMKDSLKAIKKGEGHKACLRAKAYRTNPINGVTEYAIITHEPYGKTKFRVWWE